jgi:AraC-like DNA-binding protein
MAQVELDIAPQFVGSAWRAGPELPIVSSHRHAELELNLVLHGSATYLLRSRRDRLVRCSLVWLWPSEDHILTERSTDFDMWVVVFRPGLVETHPWLEERASSGSRRLPESACDWLNRLLGQVSAAAESPAEHNVGLEFTLLQAWRLYIGAERSQLQEVHPAVERAALRLRDEPGPESAAEVAQECGLSAARLGRVFKAQMGVSLRDYRNQLCLQRFLALYGKGTRLSVTHALTESGFGSQAQFYRAFRAAFGTSPRRYLRGEATPAERKTPRDERRAATGRE